MSSGERGMPTIGFNGAIPMMGNSSISSLPVLNPMPGFGMIQSGVEDQTPTQNSIIADQPFLVCSTNRILKRLSNAIALVLPVARATKSSLE